MACRSNSKSLGFFLGEVLWAERVLELIGRLWARLDRSVSTLEGFAVVLGEVWRGFLMLDVGAGEVSRDRVRLAAGIGEREFLVVGAIVAVSSKTVVGSQVCGR